MAKNMTRKGLAFGAGLSLIATGLAGAMPANAATALKVNGFGSTAAEQHGIQGYALNLYATVEGAAATDKVLFLVEGADATELVVEGRAVTDLTTATGTTAYAAVADVDKTTVAGAKRATFGPDTSGDADITDDVIVPGKYFQFNIELTGVTATRTITITPFVDSVVFDQLPTAGTSELVGTPITVTYHAAADVVPTTKIYAPVVGATTDAVTAEVDLNLNINEAALEAGAVTVNFLKNNATTGLTSPTGVNIAWDAVDSASYATVTSTSVAATDVFSAQAFVTGGSSLGGNVALTGVSAVDVTAIVGTNSTGLNTEKSNYYLSTDASTGVSTSDAVRAGSGTITVYSTVDTVVAGASKAGQSFTFTIEEQGNSTLDLAGSITAGGKTLANSNITSKQKITVTAVSDALGKASVDIAYAGLKAGNKFTVKSAVTGSAAVVSETDTFTVTNSVASALVDTGVLGASAERGVVKGGAIAIQYQAVDQYGLTPVGTYRVAVTTSSLGSGNAVGAVTANLPMTDGVATLSVNDKSDVADNFVIDAELEKLNLAGTAYQDIDDAVSGAAAVTEASTINVTTSAPALGRMTFTRSDVAETSADKVLTLNTTAIANYDDDLVRASATEPTMSANSKSTPATPSFSGVIYATNGVGAAGVPVTVSAPGVLFHVKREDASTDEDVYSVGTVTLFTDSSGNFAVTGITSNTAGAVTLTATAGALTKTQIVTFAQAAADKGTKLELMGVPASIVPGSTLTIKAKLTDKYGNPVNTAAGDMKLSWTGGGLPVGTVPDETDAAGEIQFKYLLGSNDSGSGVVTVSWAGADGYFSTDTGRTVADDVDNLTATQTVVIGTAGNTGDLATWTKKLTDGSAKMYAKNIVGEGKVQFMLNGEEIAWVRAVDATDPKLREANGSYYLVRTVEFVEGQKNVLEIYVDGVRTTRTAYTY